MPPAASLPGHQRLGLKAILDAGREPVRAGAGLGVHGEAAAAVEAHGVGAAPLERHLLDVVAGGLRREGAEQRQRQVRAVEAVGVVLAAAARARPAHPVLGVLNAGGELHQVAKALPDGHAEHQFRSEGVAERRAAAAAEALRHHLHLLDGAALRIVQRQVDHGGLVEQHVHGNLRAAAARHDPQKVGAWNQHRQPVAAFGIRDRGARTRQDGTARLNGNPGPGDGIRGDDAFDAPSLLAPSVGRRKQADDQEGKDSGPVSNCVQVMHAQEPN